MTEWAEMEDWCRRQSKAAGDAFEARFWALHEAGNPDMDDRELRRLLGNSEAFGRMRSYISGARKQSA